MRLSLLNLTTPSFDRQVKSLRPATRWHIIGIVLFSLVWTGVAQAAGQLRAGAAKVDISHPDTLPVNDPPYVKALVLKDDTTTAVVITMDVVSIGMIGTVPNDYMDKIRAKLKADLGIPPHTLLVNTSHCHASICGDIDAKTVECVKAAWAKLEPVRGGPGSGYEDRISENRRFKLKSGKTADARHAYSLPGDEEFAEVGPIDPQIGLYRFDRMDGTTLAVIYNYAVHPIQQMPNGKNTADMTGFSSQVVEDCFGEDTTALFIQGCGGDINPALYKDVSAPRNAETLGSLLGVSTMKAARKIKPGEVGEFKIVSQMMELPRADFAERIDRLKSERDKLVASLGGTSQNFKTFLPLAVNHGLSKDYPSYYAHRYMHDRKLGRDDYDRLDAQNKQNMAAYLANIHTMEEITRVQTNIRLLELHQGQNVAAGKRTLDVELMGLRLGDFRLLTFPGELTVQIGLNLKQADMRPNTFIAGYTNGYIYYAPTAEQLRNPGAAQEDCDTLLAPEWQEMFEKRALEMLKGL